MAKPKHIILTEDGVITQEALLAYAEGRLSAEETVRLEALLKDDPFAQDALEGIRSATAPGEMKAVITSLNVALREKTGAREKKKKGIEIHWATYAYAAMIVGILIGLGFVMVHFIADKDQRVAMNKAPQAEESAPVKDEKPVVSSIIDSTRPKADTITTQNTATSTGAATLSWTADTVAPQTYANANGTVSGNATTFYSTATPQANKASKDNQQVPQGFINATPGTYDRKAVPASAPVKEQQPKNTTTSTGRSDDAKYIVDGHDLETGKEVKTSNYKNPPTGYNESTLKDDKNLDMVTVSSAKSEKKKAKLKSEEGTVTTADKLKAARVLFDAGDYKEAAKEYNKILSDQPDNADALYFGGISDYFNGKGKQAEKNFDKLLKANLYVDGSKWYKANVLIDKGKKDEAKQLLRDLINTNSSFKDRAVKKYEEIVK